MNKRKFAAFMMAAVAMVGFASCDNDDDDDENENSGNYVEKVSTKLLGYSVANSTYFKDFIANAADVDTLNITATAEENVVAVEYKSATWGALSIKDATVSLVDGAFVVEGADSIAMASQQTGIVKNYYCEFSATVYNDSAKYVMTAPKLMGGLKLEFKTK